MYHFKVNIKIKETKNDPYYLQQEANCCSKVNLLWKRSIENVSYNIAGIIIIIIKCNYND